jgi:hypothetical protein
MTEMELSMIDGDFFFKDGNKVVHLASCGMVRDEFLEPKFEDEQDELFEYFDNLPNTSGHILKVSDDIYPDSSSFEEYGDKGLYSYDGDEGNLSLVIEPTVPLKVSDLPTNIQNLLTNW